MPLNFTCTCCLEQYDGAPRKVIAGMLVCAPCVTDLIIPIIQNALKYEAQYPPMFGHVELDPDDFVDCFDNAKVFMEEWNRKSRRYLTPYKARVYCSSCEAFLCAKPRDGATPKIRCGECEALTCYPCGANVTEHAALHVCPGAPAEDGEKADNPFSGMERGKDYQICPNEECKMPVELKDGCNHMICEAASCGTEFCFICGEEVEAGPRSGHWNVGGKCSRYNHPESDNPVYDNDHADLPARLRAALDGDAEEARLIGEGTGADELDGGTIEDALLGLHPVDLLGLTIGPQAYNAHVQSGIRLMNDVPALPDLTGLTDAQQLAAEDAMSAGLEATALGEMMLQHQREVDHMWDLAAARLTEADDEGFAVPAWLELAVELMIALRLNLSVYIYRIRLRAQFAAFEDRHDALEAAYGPHQATILANYPRFYEILIAYAPVAEIRMLGAATVLEGGDPAVVLEREGMTAGLLMEGFGAP